MRIGILKKHILVIVLLLCLPVIINFVLLIPSFTPVVGGSIEWLSFWAGYISANVAFIILYIQRKDNKRENKRNRELQLNILKHQQEMQWLNMFRKASVDYVSSYNYNDLVHSINIMRKNPEEAFNVLGALLDRLAKSDTNLAYIGWRGENHKVLYDICAAFFTLYNDVINDVQNMLIYIINSKNVTFEAFCIDSKNMDITTEMRNIIAIIATQDGINMAQRFNDVAITRIKIIEERAEKIRDVFAEYITAEQKRIDDILTADLK